jgi:hypothetical protein
MVIIIFLKMIFIVKYIFHRAHFYQNKNLFYIYKILFKNFIKAFPRLRRLP